MSKIDSEIDALAERMVKSATDSRQLLFDTIMNLGPEGLKKAAANLSPEDQSLLKSALAEMHKAASVPKEAEEAKKLTPEKTETPAKKMKTESLSGSDDEDEKLMESGKAEHRAQGGPADSPLEGQVIKGREIGQEHRGPGGGIIIGHTSTGKPMYANAEHPAHVDHNPQDHKEQAEKHEGLARDIRDKMQPGKPEHQEQYSQARMHENQALEHRKMAGKKEDEEMKKNCGYGGSMMKSLRKEIKQEKKLVKSLFNNMTAISYESKDKPEMTKEQCMQDISWKLSQLKDLRDQSWLIEQEAPEAKELFEKKFSKLKSEIRALCEKHSGLKKAYENFMTKGEKHPKDCDCAACEKLEKKQGVPEGVDPEKWERGVREVKAQGHDKTSAIKIVNASMAKSFKEVEEAAEKEGADDPKAVAAAVGFKKLGKEEMERRAQTGKEKSMKKGDDLEGQEDKAIDKLKEIQEKEKKQLSPEEKLEKKKMKKAKKIKKSLKKIVQLAKSLKMTKEQVVKAIKDANNNLKLVKAEMRVRLAKGEGMDSFKPNPEVDQVKPGGQDKKEAGDVEEKPNKDKGDLEIKSDETADQALAKIPEMKKSVNWKMKSSIEAGSLGRNAHYEVGAMIEKAEQDREATMKKGGLFFNETEIEELRKAQVEKADINDLIAKGLDFSPDQITRIEGVRDHKVDGTIKLQKSFADEDIMRALGMDEKTYKELMGE